MSSHDSRSRPANMYSMLSWHVQPLHGRFHVCGFKALQLLSKIDSNKQLANSWASRRMHSSIHKHNGATKHERSQAPPSNHRSRSS